METKFNSQICTTKEQSERLLALGLKRETADMELAFSDSFRDGVIILPGPPEEDEDFPAWSLGRLVEMMPNSIHNKRILAYLTIMNDRVLYDTIKCDTYSASTTAANRPLLLVNAEYVSHFIVSYNTLSFIIVK